MISHRKPNETMRDYFNREYALCTSRVDKYYVLQSLRRDQGYFGAAKFYQHEAARWHERAMECHHQWLISSWRTNYTKIVLARSLKPSATFVRIGSALAATAFQ